MPFCLPTFISTRSTHWDPSDVLLHDHLVVFVRVILHLVCQAHHLPVVEVRSLLAQTYHVEVSILWYKGGKHLLNYRMHIHIYVAFTSYKT